MPSRNSISAETKEEVLSLRGTGLSYDKIAKQQRLVDHLSSKSSARMNGLISRRDDSQATENPLLKE